jgi:hypothetical protein
MCVCVRLLIRLKSREKEKNLKQKTYQRSLKTDSVVDSKKFWLKSESLRSFCRLARNKETEKKEIFKESEIGENACVEGKERLTTFTKRNYNRNREGQWLDIKIPQVWRWERTKERERMRERECVCVRDKERERE